MAAARDRLSRPELIGEAIYELMRRGALTKEQLCQRMSALDNTPESAPGAAYATWLLIRSHPPSPEKTHHMEVVKQRLRELARYQ